jgi:hypothetical protein
VAQGLATIETTATIGNENTPGEPKTPFGKNDPTGSIGAVRLSIRLMSGTTQS